MPRSEEPGPGRDSDSTQPTPNGSTASRPRARSAVAAVRRLLKEPLTHFLLIGVVLFVANEYAQRSGSGAAAPQRILLTLDELQQLEMLFQSQWRRQPTPQEFDALVETKVKEEILYHEALTLGLDKDDEIVKRRMAQKMQFVAEDVAEAHEPSTTELRTWFAANATKFALPGRITFRQIYFSPDQRGARARDDAMAALKKLVDKPIDSPLAAGDATLLQGYYGDRAPDQLAKDFGPVFAQAAFGLAAGSWQGPIESGFGWHLLFVDSNIPGRLPSFEEVEPDVKIAWLGEQKAIAWQKAYDTMRAKYVVLLPKPPEAVAR